MGVVWKKKNSGQKSAYLREERIITLESTQCEGSSARNEVLLVQSVPRRQDEKEFQRIGDF